MDKQAIPMTVDETIRLGYWEGFAAGVKLATEHMRQLMVQSVVKAQKPVVPVPVPGEAGEAQ